MVKRGLNNLEMQILGSYHPKLLLFHKVEALFVGFCSTHITKTYVENS